MASTAARGSGQRVPVPDGNSVTRRTNVSSFFFFLRAMVHCAEAAWGEHSVFDSWAPRVGLKVLFLAGLSHWQEPGSCRSCRWKRQFPCEIPTWMAPGLTGIGGCSDCLELESFTGDLAKKAGGACWKWGGDRSQSWVVLFWCFSFCREKIWAGTRPFFSHAECQIFSGDGGSRGRKDCR